MGNIPKSGCSCLYLISSFFFPIFKHYNVTSHFFQELWGLEDWNLVHTWTVGRCIVYTGIELLLLLLIWPFLSSFFFLPNFQTLIIFVTLFSGTVRPWRLKLGTHADSGWMYRVYRNQAAVAYSSLCFFCIFIFLSLQLSSIKLFCQGFLGNYEAKKFETSYKHEQWVDILRITISECCFCLEYQAAVPYSSLSFFNLFSLQFSNI